MPRSPLKKTAHQVRKPVQSTSKQRLSKSIHLHEPLSLFCTYLHRQSKARTVKQLTLPAFCVKSLASKRDKLRLGINSIEDLNKFNSYKFSRRSSSNCLKFKVNLFISCFNSTIRKLFQLMFLFCNSYSIYLTCYNIFWMFSSSLKV